LRQLDEVIRNVTVTI